MRKLLVLPLMLVMMPYAFAFDLNPIDPNIQPYYSSRTECKNKCSLSHCYSKMEQVCPSGWTKNSSGVCTRTGGTTHDTTNHRYITTMYGSCNPTTEERWYCANSCPTGCDTCCPTSGTSLCTQCQQI